MNDQTELPTINFIENHKFKNFDKILRMITIDVQNIDPDKNLSKLEFETVIFV